MCVAASQLVKNEYGDVLRAEKISTKFFINMFTLYTIIRFFDINSYAGGFYGLYKCST